jgi:hypothetical protein
MAINKIPTSAFTTVDLLVDTFTATSGQTAVVLSTSTTVNACIVLVNDVMQAPTTDYTISGNTLTFTSALSLNDEVIVRILARPTGYVSGGGGSESVDLSSYYTKTEVDAMMDDIIAQIEALSTP